MTDFKKENGDGGGFGDGGGTVFTSTDAGVFTPTYGGGKKKKKKGKKSSGLRRLADFINNNTPKIKSKGVIKAQQGESFVLDLIKWVSYELQKDDSTTEQRTDEIIEEVDEDLVSEDNKETD